jgi:hypothetical protein
MVNTLNGNELPSLTATPGIDTVRNPAVFTEAHLLPLREEQVQAEFETGNKEQ